MRYVSGVVVAGVEEWDRSGEGIGKEVCRCGEACLTFCGNFLLLCRVKLLEEKWQGGAAGVLCVRFWDSEYDC